MAQEFDIQPVNLLPQASDSDVNKGEVIIVSGGNAKRASSIKMKGEKGDKGDQGIQGIQGIQGNSGPQGTKGDKGEKGDTGPAGPQGPKGEKGDTGSVGPQGAKGDKGDTGKGFDILGYYETLAQLKTAVPNPTSGDAYGVGTSEPYDIYVFDGVSNDWINNGPIQGPQGIQGPVGPQGNVGKSAYQEWLDQGYSGTELDFVASLKGETGSRGLDGNSGENGDSAYQIWLNKGHSGTEQDFLGSLIGPAGKDGQNGMLGTTTYNDVSDKPSVNGVELVGNKTTQELKLSTKHKYVTLLPTGWIQNGTKWYVNIDDAEISSTNTVWAAPANESEDIFLNAQVYSYGITEIGKFTIYARNKPEGNILLNYSILQ
ncbi:MAG: collagen-like protein [Tannerella sp.]|jgi:hypothetical protein|nr:collagen-like protein [Tannerella sp.]